MGTQPHAALEACPDVCWDCFIAKPLLRHNKNWPYFELSLTQIPTIVPISERMFMFVFVFVCGACVRACVR